MIDLDDDTDQKGLEEDFELPRFGPNGNQLQKNSGKNLLFDISMNKQEHVKDPKQDGYDEANECEDIISFCNDRHFSPVKGDDKQSEKLN